MVVVVVVSQQHRGAAGTMIHHWGSSSHTFSGPKDQAATLAGQIPPVKGSDLAHGVCNKAVVAGTGSNEA